MGRSLTLFAPVSTQASFVDVQILLRPSLLFRLLLSAPTDHSAVNYNQTDHLSIRDRKRMTHGPRCILALTSAHVAISPLSLRGEIIIGF